MALISLQEITLAFGGPLLFDRISLQLEPGERVALLGRNGVGKTTLMKVMAGQVEIDGGDILYQKGVKITHLPQEVPNDIVGTVFDIVFSGLGERAKLLKDYHHVVHRLHTEHTPQLMQELDRLQTELNHTNGWDLDAEAEDVLAHMKLNGDDDFETLSGGQKRRVLLAKALVIKPEILLLDEPTNHLDIDTIDWLEEFLKKYPGTVFFVTHDRMFMTHLATRIIELDRGKLFNWSCNYQTFLERKQMALEVEAAQRDDFDKKLAVEEVWIRKGIKARRTRNEGRVRELERMRKEKKAQRQQIGQVRMQSQESDASGRQVIKVEHLGFSYGDNCIVRDLSTQIMRGDKIGVIGANGSGKTTLLRILIGQLQPQRGKASLGTNLEILYYDQLREQLDDQKTVIENIAGGADTVTINGKPRHIIGYLQDFLFTPDRARTPVKVLSGGERNRLLLARFFIKPSNFLVMDEPTNDLDIETQELLEELLTDYSGTLILVSHDRVLLNNVVTSTIVLEGNGVIKEYVGGYDDWLSQYKVDKPQVAEPVKETQAKKSKKTDSKRKLSFKEEKEVKSLFAQIQKIEEEREKLYAFLADVTIYQTDPKGAAEAQAREEDIVDELLELYQRWEELEAA
ncbi:MAG: ATP-binding cassette domain-containing protein [Candidatus Omnitrophica bacterium]|nr:ATP-binding cassette domain-containing protein [Candidatus Omnitrophota bacterium]MBU1997603.1 ATP-binding cassette domain-containing protein [Candidatus Omnitrophota bacterium]MBU4333859.1 ATP-binding cassette domain-containing protein [Candidatus Omnitrophota bacterium]